MIINNFFLELQAKKLKPFSVLFHFGTEYTLTQLRNDYSIIVFFQ